MLTLIPCILDWSIIPVIPSIFLSLTSSAIFWISKALLTIYGSSVIIISVLPFGRVLISDTARTLILPRPVRYASSIPDLPSIVAPVGKSGPFTISISSSIVVSLSSRTRLSIIFKTALITSLRLCGGILVAIPTAIPDVPFTRRLGYLEGSTTGSFSVSSKLGIKSTVSLPMSASISIESFVSLASVYRIAAAPSPSMEPKLP